MARKLCIVCKTRNGQTGQGQDVEQSDYADQCNYCFTEGGHENTHSDNGHNEDEPVEGCWICHPEINLALSPAAAKAPRKGHHSPRRPQINHKACGHAPTPKARRECRKAFWAAKAEQAPAPVLTAQYEGLVEWDSMRGGTRQGFIAKDLGGGRLQVRTSKGGYVTVAFASLRLV